MLREQMSLLRTLKEGTCEGGGAARKEWLDQRQRSSADRHGGWGPRPPFAATLRSRCTGAMRCWPLPAPGRTSPANGLPLWLRAMPATGLVCARALAAAPWPSGSCLKEPATPMPSGPSAIELAVLGSWEPSGSSPLAALRAMVGVCAACGGEAGWWEGGRSVARVWKGR